MSHHKLSLRAAIFININIMLGSGIFINTTILSKQAGILGFLSYIAIGILMLPLIYCITQLLAVHPSGGFYVFARQEINPFAGFISTWSYFIGKLSSAVIVIHIAILLLQQIFPILQGVSPLFLDTCVIIFFVLLNMLDLKTGSIIQSFFLGFKLLPIFFVIVFGFYLFSPWALSATPIIWQTFPLTLPLVLFAIAGFEAACSLSNRIENSQVNGPKAIYVSYFFVIGATALFQLALSCALGPILNTLPDYRFVFPAFFEHLFTDIHTQVLFSHVMHLAIAASALGGAYGILFSNAWNLYVLAQHNHILLSEYFTRFNRFHIPWLCVIAEGIICLIYLGISQGSQLPLQQMGALGPSIAYSLSALSLLYAQKNKNITFSKKAISYLALLNCMALIGVALFNLVITGFYSLLIFGLLFMLGSAMFFWTPKGTIES